MPRRTKPSESDYYPLVRRFLEKRFSCFVTGQDRGTKFGRVDVVGARDIGKSLTGAFEVIAVEVKAGNQPFNTAIGQAYGYSVYAERCYLADVRSRLFSLEEIDIASSLSVGLLLIRENGNISEVLASPVHKPLIDMKAELLFKLGYAQCTVCGTAFQCGDDQNWERHVKRYVKKAWKQQQGLVYWLHQRKQPGEYKERRYICVACIHALYDEVLGKLGPE